MVTLRWILDDETDRDLRKKALKIIDQEIGPGLKDQPIMAGKENFSGIEQVVHTTVYVRYPAAEFLPASGMCFSFNDNWNARSGLS